MNKRQQTDVGGAPSNAFSQPGVATSTESRSITTITVGSQTTPTPEASPQSTTQITCTAGPSVSSPAQSAVSGSQKPSQGISSATVAGATVGAAIGGALLAALLIWLSLNRRNSRRSRQDRARDRKNEKILHPNKENNSTTEVLLTSSWRRHLPQPIDDETLRLQMRTVFQQIELHVENFYVDEVSGVVSFEAVRSNVNAFNDADLADDVSALIYSSKRATAVIKRCLARLVVSNMSASEAQQSAFLPVECTALPIARNKMGSKSKERVVQEAYSDWRVLTAYLSPDLSQELQSQDNLIEHLATDFCAAFTPWSSSKHSAKTRIQNLVDIMKNAAKVGVIIFSQPSEFVYVWQAENHTSQRVASRHANTIVVTPGFLKVTDEHMRPLKRDSQLIVPPIVAQL